MSCSIHQIDPRRGRVGVPERLALGYAQFATANPTDCLTPGVGAATLTANFRTVRPLE